MICEEDSQSQFLPLPFSSKDSWVAPKQQTEPFESFEMIAKISNGRHPVYLVYHSARSQHYIMKIFHHLEGTEPPLSFQNESRFQNLDHPNLVRYTYVDRDHTITCQDIKFHFSYILSEYLPNGNLLDLLCKNPSFSSNEKLIRTFFVQLVDAVQYLHSYGIAHLDIKLENVLLDADYCPRLIDFDLAFCEGDCQIISKGTPKQRAPELAQQFKGIDPYSADVYSLGCIQFMMKSGGVFPHLEKQNYKGVNLFNLMVLRPKDFWAQHELFAEKKEGYFSSEFRELFEGMTQWQKENRWNLKQVSQSKWVTQGEVYDKQALKEIMKGMLEVSSI